MITESEARRIVMLLTAVVIVDIAYWVTWFADRSLVASTTRSAYDEFENAFPLADGWLALCCIGALVALRRGSPAALLWLLLGAGAGFYLFGMDVLYDLEHGIWWSSGAGGVIELVINLLTAVTSGYLIGWTWSRRESLLAPASADRLERQGNR